MLHSDRKTLALGEEHEEELLGFSLYQGRTYLGRFVGIEGRRYEAVDKFGRTLGEFCSRRAAVAAIRSAWGSAE
jgi:hypothetical protein